MQENRSSLEQSLHVESSNGQNPGDVGSNSTLSDSGSWDTDFEDDRTSESSGLYGDVDLSLVEKSSCEAEGKPKSSGQSRVAALAKTVAASLAASGSQGKLKAVKSYRSNPVGGCEDGKTPSSSWKISSNSVKSLPSKPLARPPVPLRPSAATHNTHSYKLANLRGLSSGPQSLSNTSTLPKPPGATSEQVQQVIGALGHLWPSDSMSLSSQNQSDDDYEPIQSDTSPQMNRLNVHSSYTGQKNPSKSHLLANVNSANNCSVTIPEVHSVQEDNDIAVPQNTPFLHSPAAAAALASAAASAVNNRLSHCSKRSSSSESNTYSPSSGSSLSEHSSQSALSGQQEGVYEPIEEKNKKSSCAQKSYLHNSEKSEKLEAKRTTNTQQEQRPPVPNRPLPPTPKPSDHIKGGPLAAGLENQPWFHNVDRKQAEQLIKNGPDGYFLIRPSSQSQNPLTLTLLFNERVYNISVRQRKDGRIALGFEKPDEQSFDSIEEMVSNYQSENLLLFSRNERTGRTVLTKSPPKQRMF